MTNKTSDKFLQSIRDQFPILKEQVNGHSFNYLDSGASAQKPLTVLNAMDTAAKQYYANIHRGLYDMSEETSRVFEGVRGTVARFINASSEKEVIFTKNSTESFNLMAYSFGSLLTNKDAVLISELEHHANIVPWTMLRERSGVSLKVVPINDGGDLDMQVYEEFLKAGDVKLVSLTAMSNVLGTKPPLKEISKLAHKYGAKVLFDMSQRIVHDHVDVQECEADFIIFTGHKLYGPTGVGVLWGKYEELEKMPPFLGGGDMIKNVSFEKVTYGLPPHRFEAGTPPILEVIGLGEAIRFVTSIDKTWRLEHEKKLTQAMEDALNSIEGVKILGAPKDKGSVFSFIADGAHPHDISLLLNQKGVALRAGQHCAEPLMNRLGVPASARISGGIYTSLEEIDSFKENLKEVLEMLRA